MKPYGVDKQDAGCCPGHDKFSPECYSSRRSQKAHSKARHLAHSRARARNRKELKNIDTNTMEDC